MEPAAPDRILLIDKPREWTSFDVVNKLRHKLKIKKIGHAGTLDPLATGLLIICTGKMTKRIEEFQAQEKEYTGELVIGQTTPSHDLETPVSQARDISLVTLADVERAARKFVGDIEQVPPMHSAIKVAGKRAYELARQGKETPLRPRRVRIDAFDILTFEPPRVQFRVVCSKGTYIRSLARDIGNELGVGAYLSTLCRTRIGAFSLINAQTIEQVGP